MDTIDALNDDQEQKNDTSLKLLEQEPNVIKKMGTFKTFFAGIKAYCAITVLLLPRSFANGGYILSPLAMVCACFFESFCAARLATVAF